MSNTVKHKGKTSICIICEIYKAGIVWNVNYDGIRRSMNNIGVILYRFRKMLGDLVKVNIERGKKQGSISWTLLNMSQIYVVPINTKTYLSLHNAALT